MHVSPKIETHMPDTVLFSLVQPWTVLSCVDAAADTFDHVGCGVGDASHEHSIVLRYGEFVYWVNTFNTFLWSLAVSMV